MCPKWHVLSSLSFFSHDPFSLFSPALPFFFRLSPILCSFFQFIFLSPYFLCLSFSASLSLPIFLSPLFPFSLISTRFIISLPQ